MTFLKLLPYIIILVLAIALVVAIGFAVKKQPPAKVTEITNTYRVSEPVVTKIIRQNVPAVIDTMLVNNKPHGIASYTETIKKDKTTVDLDIKYDLTDRVFDVNAGIYSVRDSVYVETIKTIEKTIKHKFIMFTGAIGVGFEKDDTSGQIGLANSDVALGIKLANRYSVCAFVDTRKSFGMRFGVDF
jgi:hypothetical protein